MTEPSGGRRRATVRDLDAELAELERQAERREVGREASVDIAASDGLVPVSGIDIPAGMLVEIRAAGRYTIGSWNDSTLGPSGYPGGGPREYNLPGPEFRRAKHGAAVALLQIDSAAQAVVVGECTRFVAEAGGRSERQRPQQQQWTAHLRDSCERSRCPNVVCTDDARVHTLTEQAGVSSRSEEQP